jgi:hypothetical protein
MSVSRQLAAADLRGVIEYGSQDVGMFISV